MGPIETTSVGSVPASVSTSMGGGGVDVGMLLRQIQGDTATQQKLMREAITPVSGAHAGQVPTAMTRPIPPGGTAQGYANPRNKGQAIANMITGAGNLVSKIISEEKQKKQDHLVDQTTKLLTAQQESDEARQQKESANAMLTNATGEEAKSYQATITKADEIIAKNDAVIKGIAPKDMKSIAKGMNFNYIDPSENKTEEHDAVKKALEKVQGFRERREAAAQARKDFQAKNQPIAAQNFATAFSNSQPQGMAPNQMAQARYAGYMEAQKANAAATKALIPLLSAQVRANSAESLETRREAHTDNLALMKSQDSWERLNASILARQNLAKTEFGYKLHEIAAEGSKELAVFKAKLVEKNADPLTSVKAYQDFQTKSATTKSKLAETVSTLQIQREQAAKQKPYNASMVSNLDQQLSVAKQAQETYGQAADGVTAWYNKIAGVSNEDKPSESRSSSSSLSSASTYVSDSAADPDEDEDNY
jgi:hypothetical protein